MFCRTMWLGYFSFALHMIFVLGLPFSCDEEIDFECRSGQCLTASWRCDGQIDCGDGGDEEDCPFQSCLPHHFVCGGGKCLPSNSVCDGEVDCTDLSDEAPATCNRSCLPTEFACGGTVTNECISKDWLCDGEKDCTNGADESDCGEGKLAPAPPTDIPTKTPAMTSTMKGGTTLAPVWKVAPATHKPPRISIHPIPHTELPPPVIQPVTFADVNRLRPVSPGEGKLAPAPPTDIPTKTPGMTSTMKGETTLAPVRKVAPATHKPPRISIHPIPHTAEPALQGKIFNFFPAAVALFVLVLLVLACAAGFFIFHNRLLEVKTTRSENMISKKTPDGEV